MALKLIVFFPICLICFDSGLLREGSAGDERTRDPSTQDLSLDINCLTHSFIRPLPLSQSELIALISA